MYNSEILIYEISKHPTIETIVKALDKSIEITSKSKEKRIFYSGQGWAYQKINTHQGQKQRESSNPCQEKATAQTTH